MHMRFRVLSAVSALVVCLFVAGNTASAQDKKASSKTDKTQQAEIDAAVKILDNAMLKGSAGPTDYKFTWVNHPMKGRDGKAWVPFILCFDKGQPLPPAGAFFLRVVNKATAAETVKALTAYNAAVEKAETAARLDPENAELADAEEKARASAPKVDYAFQDFKMVGFNNAQANSMFLFPSSLVVANGDFDVYLLIKETAASVKGKKAPAKGGLLKTSLTVPNYYTDELTTSPVILSNSVQQLKTAPTAADLARNPYVFGSTVLTPSLTDRFAKTDDLTFFFFIYNTGLDKASGKPDVSVDYNFYTKTDTTEKYFNKTPPMLLNASTLPANFDLKAGFVLPGTQVIPLGSFPEGEYRLEIKIADKVTGKTKTENVKFTVVAK
jgi:hypothetical protein